ncbi:RidA family protein [Parafrigoribacterium soli]|uniref:RidA family protein n=1 Tax=Parafrigoribacterium soli TaxID=3144663 RepID=UPI0032EF1E30
MAELEQIQLDPSKAHWLPYAPAIKVPANSEYYFLSGATAIPLYHMHPHIDEECVLPDDIQEQTRRVMRTILEVLEFNGLTWKNVIHVYEFLTDMRDADLIHATMGEFLAGTDWNPADTMIGVNTLSAPGARFELDVIAARAID